MNTSRSHSPGQLRCRISRASKSLLPAFRCFTSIPPPMRKLSLLLAVSAALLCPAVSVHAALIAYEGFDYAVGPLETSNGGTGWASAWSATGNTVASPGFGVTAASHPTTGNLLDLGGNNIGNIRVPTSSPDAVGSTLYLSFIADVDSADYAGFSLFEGGTENLFLGKTFGNPNWGIDIGGTGVNTTTPTSTQSLLVFRLDFGGGTTLGDTLIRMYVNPAVGTEPITADASIEKANFTWDQIRVQAGLGAADGAFDEIRFGTAYGDVAVVPEPATAGLVAVGLVGIAAMRRRRGRNAHQPRRTTVASSLN